MCLTIECQNFRMSCGCHHLLCSCKRAPRGTQAHVIRRQQTGFNRRVNAAGPLLFIHQCGTYLLQCHASLSWLGLASVLGIQQRIPVALPHSGWRGGECFCSCVTHQPAQKSSCLLKWSSDDPQGLLQMGPPVFRGGGWSPCQVTSLSTMTFYRSVSVWFNMTQ